jgi:hypothetical protein
MDTLRIIACMVVIIGVGTSQVQSARSPVLNRKAAREIAETELVRVYGASVRSEEPFSAKLKGGIWTVAGTRRCQENLPRGYACFGGHWAHVAKEDGRILDVGTPAASR